MREALYYEKMDERLLCNLCPHACRIAEGRTGLCRTRQNINGTLYAVNYGQVSSYALDPIEKKPLYHFYPGSYILSAGTFGCNLACGYCQNWQIAHADPATEEISPQELVQMAQALQERGNIGIAYTYSEPCMWYEYVLDCAKLIKTGNMKNVLVTNGFINPEPLRALLPYIDALNIDVKGSTDFYQQVCAGNLDDVRHTVEICARQCHVEITYLVIPGLNDTQQEVRAFSVWLAGINKNIPVHFTRYYPNYKLDKPPTAIQSLLECRRTAAEQLNYAYIGNVTREEQNTYCPACGFLVIDRIRPVANININNKCPHCGNDMNIIGEVKI